jgi:hypothetical protein
MAGAGAPNLSASSANGRPDARDEDRRTGVIVVVVVIALIIWGILKLFR